MLSSCWTVAPWYCASAARQFLARGLRAGLQFGAQFALDAFGVAAAPAQQQRQLQHDHDRRRQRQGRRIRVWVMCQSALLRIQSAVW